MRSTASSLLALGLASCAGLGGVSSPVAAALVEAPAEPAQLVLEGAVFRSIMVPIAATAVPILVKRAAEDVHPGGETVVVGKEWGGRGTGYRIVKSYPADGGSHLRSLLIDERGVVLERTHELPARDAPAPVLEQATRLARGGILRVEVVAGEPGDEHFRVTLQNKEGRRTQFEAREDGSHMRWARLINAQISASD